MKIDICEKREEALQRVGLDTATLLSVDARSTVVFTLSSSLAENLVKTSRDAETTSASMPWGEVKIIILACSLETAKKKVQAL